ncbi:branched-chain amino acid ABC transporter permease [Rhodopseudomonas pseudopalustris]|uniref:Amino acid/amide ABC transporter membrane protein 1, HAAT family n=1 Tax=Rhodopseudomonas pseudopalustris TaxID=1513892 RepID=A0A1H8M8N9_9BRAD|nr:branched-chain amino acid ABC transporter permease [Rhodopseudomonas pseudopalustris]SEO13709.1 amino acid/amide ABC transporter membrane protein 1, HAAT family [Rhodopseudomonas pseudopalustris]
MDTFWQIIANGIMLGALYAIVSVGLTLIFGIIKVINFAHGEFLMIGMYLTYVLTNAVGIHPYATIVLVVPILFCLGALTQKLLIQPLMSAQDDHIQILATVGLSTALINLALLVFGADVASTPPHGLRTSVELGPVRVLIGQLLIFVLSIVVVLALQLFLSRSQTGRAVRAVAQNRAAAQIMGINVNWIFVLTFGVGSACVGVAAVAVAPLYPSSPSIGTYFALTCFVVVVLGGLGSIGGAFVGAMIIGLIDSFAGFYLGSDLREIAVFGVFLLLLIVKPTGLFSARLNLSHVSQ